MHQSVFFEGVEELKLFFPRFAPKDGTLKAWYHRLKYFEDDAFRLAVFEITEQENTPPSFKRIKGYCFDAKKRLAKPVSNDVAITSAVAPASDERWDLCKMYMGALFEAMKVKDEEDRKKQLGELKRMWVGDYRNLPGYKTKGQLQVLKNQERWEELSDYKFVPEQFKRDIFVPRFTNEQQREEDSYSPIIVNTY